MNTNNQHFKYEAKQDKEASKAEGLSFSLCSFAGWQLEDDEEYKNYQLYPEDNWVEVTEGAPIAIIASNGYGKPILDRVLMFGSSIKLALEAGFFSFDTTPISANNVDYAIDVILYKKDSFQTSEKCYKKDELQKVSMNWNAKLRKSIDRIPNIWIDSISGFEEERQYLQATLST